MHRRYESAVASTKSEAPIRVLTATTVNLMRIAQVCPYSLSVPGGVQGQVLGLARALRSLGHEARVLAPCDGPPPDSMVTPLGKSVPTAVNGSMAPIAPDPACALRTIHALRNERFDVVHLHEPVVPGPTLTSLLTSDAPMLGTFHAAGTGTSYNYLPQLTKRLAGRLKVRVAVSDDARLTAEHNLGGRYEVLYNGIEIDRFRADRNDERNKSPIILFIGRHEHRKGLSVLLEAMKHLPKNVRLQVAGIGPQTAAFREQTAGDSRIEWLGRINDVEKVQHLARADVFCAPSIEGESFGIVLLEAMAAQVPVVASDLPGYRNVGRNGVDALMVPPNDVDALAAALQRVIDDRTLATALVAAGAERAATFSMLGLAEKYLGLYERCMSQYPFVV